MIRLLPATIDLVTGTKLADSWRRWWADVIRKTPERVHPTTVTTAAFTATPWDLVLYDPSSGTFAVTLPQNPEDGTEVALKNVTSDTTGITVEAASGDTIDGAASFIDTGANSWNLLIFDANRREWYRFS